MELEGMTAELERFQNETTEVSDGYDAVGEINVELMTGIEGFEDELLLVTGSPFEIAPSLDCAQGDNVYQAASDCGLVSCANYLTICGVEANEDTVLQFALDHNLCTYSVFGSPQEWGGTTCMDLEAILESHSVDSSIFTPYEANGSLEGIASAVENGHAAILGVNAGYLWNEPSCVENGQMNHWVTITGTVRDSSGELVALTICDSGRCLESDSCRTVPVKDLEACYTNAAYTSVVISDHAVR